MKSSSMEDITRAPVKPASFRALTVLKTCSMQGLKQHMRVVRSFCGDWHILRVNTSCQNTKKVHTLRACLACSTASHGAGRSRNTRGMMNARRVHGPQILRTSVNCTCNRKSILADVAMGQSDYIRHPVPDEFFSVIFGIC
jgi:hypothetical protein